MENREGVKEEQVQTPNLHSGTSDFTIIRAEEDHEDEAVSRPSWASSPYQVSRPAPIKTLRQMQSTYPSLDEWLLRLLNFHTLGNGGTGIHTPENALSISRQTAEKERGTSLQTYT